MIVKQAATLCIPEGFSTNRALDFDGKDFYYWKGKMKLFLEFQDVDMWDIIEIGPYKPTKRNQAGIEID